MLFDNDKNKHRKRSYYPFSKNYPSKSGNIYAIGESRTRSIREKRNRVIFYCSMVVLFALVFVGLSVAISLSRKPLTDVGATKASEYNGKLRAYYMPEDALGGGIAYSLFKTRLINAKANAVYIELKKPDGRLNYKSQLDTVRQTRADEAAYEAANSVIKQLKDDGYRIIAKVSCFEDTLAASMLVSASVSEADGSVWLDKSAQDNGNPWLNPYSQTAREYLLSVIGECVELGADVIVLDSVCFPDSDRTDAAVFAGEQGSIQSRNAVLHSFVSSAAEVCGDVPIAVCLTADGAINGSQRLYEGSMFDSDALFDAVDLRPQTVRDSIVIGERIIDKQDINENTLIQLSVPIINQKLDDNFTTKGLIPIVDDEIYIATLENMGIDNYIIVK